MMKRIPPAAMGIAGTLTVLSILMCGGTKREAQTRADTATGTTTPQPAEQPSPAAEAHPAKQYVESLSSLDEVNAIIEGTPGRLLVFDLYADWCRPCRMLAPTFAALAEKHHEQVSFYRVDLQKDPEIAPAFNVSGIPHVSFIKDKHLVHIVRGLNPSEEYERVITLCDSTMNGEECRRKMQLSM